MEIISEITITTEKENYGDWLKIFIPYHTTEKITAYIQTLHGEIIRHVKLNVGNNAIDMSSIEEKVVDVKIDTPYEIISRKINLTPQ